MCKSTYGDFLICNPPHKVHILRRSAGGVKRGFGFPLLASRAARVLPGLPNIFWFLVVSKHASRAATHHGGFGERCHRGGGVGRHGGGGRAALRGAAPGARPPGAAPVGRPEGTGRQDCQCAPSRRARSSARAEPMHRYRACPRGGSRAARRARPTSGETETGAVIEHAARFPCEHTARHGG